MVAFDISIAEGGLADLVDLVDLVGWEAFLVVLVAFLACLVVHSTEDIEVNRIDATIIRIAEVVVADVNLPFL